MDFWSLYATDPALEEQGKVFSKEFGPGITFTLARVHNDTYERVITQLIQAHQFTLDQKDTPEQRKAAKECSDRIMIEVLSKTIVLGWTGPVYFQKELLTYSVANAAKLLGMKEFREKVSKLANDFQNFRYAQETEDLGNSESTSAGTLTGVPA